MSSLNEKIDTYRTALNKHITEAFEVRQTLTADNTRSDLETPEYLYDHLKYTRHVTDRLEHILVQVTLIKANTDKLKAQTAADLEDAEIEKFSQRTPNDYTTSRERDIEFNTRTITQRRDLRKTTDLTTDAQSVVESVRVMHRGADSHRREIDTRLRAITLRTALDK